MAFKREDYLRVFRERNPDLTDWNDEQILDAYRQQFATEGSLDAHPELKVEAPIAVVDDLPRWDFQKETVKAEEPSSYLGQIGSELSKGFARGTDRMQGQLYDTVRLGADTLGLDSAAEWGRKGYLRNEEEAQQAGAAAVANFESVRSAKDFGLWLSSIVAENAPQMGGTLAAGAAATLAAPGITAAGLIGSTAFGFTQMQNYGDLVEQGGEDAKKLAIANGLIGGALEAIPAGRALDAFGGKLTKSAVGQWAERIIKGTPAAVLKPALELAEHGSTEMLTEVAQEFITISTEAASFRNQPEKIPTAEQIQSRLINAAVAGFALGAVTEGGAKYLRNQLGVKDDTEEKKDRQPGAPAAAEPDVNVAVPSVIPGSTEATNQSVLLPNGQLGLPGMIPDTTSTFRVESDLPIPSVQDVRGQMTMNLSETLPPDVVPPRVFEEAAANMDANPQVLRGGQLAFPGMFPQETPPPLVYQEEPLTKMVEPPSAPGQRKLPFENGVPRIALPSRNASANAPKVELPTGELVDVLPDGQLGLPGITPDAPIAPIATELPTPVEDTATGDLQFLPPRPNLPHGLDAFEQYAQYGLPGPATSFDSIEMAYNPTPIKKVRKQRTFKKDETPGRINPITGEWEPLTAQDAEQLLGVQPVVGPDGTVEFQSLKQTEDLWPEEQSQQVEASNRRAVKRKPSVEADSRGAGEQTPSVEAQTPAPLAETVTPPPAQTSVAVLPPLKSVMSAEKFLLSPSSFSARAGNDITTDAKTSLAYVIFEQNGIRHIAPLTRAKNKPAMITISPEETKARQGRGRPTRALPAEEFFNEASGRVFLDMVRSNTPLNLSGPTRLGVDYVPSLQNVMLPKAAADTSMVAVRLTRKAFRALFKGQKNESAETLNDTLVWLRSNPDAREGANIETAATGFAEMSLKAQGLSDSEAEARVAEYLGPKKDRARYAAKAKDLFDHYLSLADKSLLNQGDLQEIERRANEIELEQDTELVVEKPKTAKREAPFGTFEQSERTRARLQRAITSLRSIVKTVSVTDLAKELGGEFDADNKHVTLLLGNLLHPTRNDVVTAYHELLEAKIEGLSPEEKAILHDWIDEAFEGNAAYDERTLTGEGLAPGRELSQLSRERLVETLAQSAADKDFFLSGPIPALFRQMKEAFIKGAMWLHEKMLGKTPNRWLAEQFAENLVTQVVANDAHTLRSFLYSLGIAERPSIAHLTVATLEHTPAHSTMYGVGGDVRYILSRGGSPADFAHRKAAEILEAGHQVQETALVERMVAFRNAPKEELLDLLNQQLQKSMTSTLQFTVVQNQISKLLQGLFQAHLAGVGGKLGADQIKAAQANGVGVANLGEYKKFLTTLGLRENQTKVDEAHTKLKAEFAAAENPQLSEILDANYSREADFAFLKSKVPEGVYDEAMSMYIEEVNKINDRLAASLADANRTAARLTDKSDERREQIVKIRRNITDIQATDQEILNVLRDQSARLKHEFEQRKNGSFKNEGHEVVAGLRGTQEIYDTLAPLFGGKITSLVETLLGRPLEALNLGDAPTIQVVKSLYALEQSGKISLHNSKLSEIRDAIKEDAQKNEHSVFRSLLTPETGEDRARNAVFLTGLIHAVKHEAHLTQLLKEQATDAKNRNEFLAKLREQLEAASEEESARLLELAKASGRVSHQTLANWYTKVKELQATQDRLAVANRVREVVPEMMKTLALSRAAAMDHLKVHFYRPVVIGGKVFSPELEATSEQLLKTQVVLEKQQARPDAIRELIRKQQRWLEAESTKAQKSPLYRTIEQENWQLREMLTLSEVGYEATGGILFDGRTSNLADEAKATGTVAGEAINRRVALFQQIMQHTNRAIQLGATAEAAEADLASRLGIARNEHMHELTRLESDASTFFQNQTFGDRAVAARQLRLDWKKRPDQKLRFQIANSDEAWSAFIRWFGKSEVASDFVRGISERYGVNVQDEALSDLILKVGTDLSADDARLLSGPLQRKSIQRGVYGTRPQTMSRFLQEGLTEIQDDLPGRFLKDDAEGVDKLAHAREGFKLLADNDVAWNHLVHPLLTSSPSSSFKAPGRADDVKEAVDIDRMARVLEGADRDLEVFARNLYKEYLKLRGDDVKTEQTEDDYVVGLHNYLFGVFRRANNLVNPRANSAVAFRGTRHMMMDAREADLMPPQWRENMKITANTMGSAVHVISANAAFGRDLSAIDALAVEVGRELSNARAIYSDEEKFNALPANRKVQIKNQAKTYDNFGEHGQVFRDKLYSILSPDSVAVSDPSALRELWNTTITLMTTGVRSGLLNAVNPINRIARFGLTTKAFEYYMRDNVNLAQELAAGFLNAGTSLFGWTWNPNGKLRSSLFESGYDAPTMSWEKLWKMAYQNPNERSGKDWRRLLAFTRNAVTRGSVGKHDPSAGPKLLANPFQNVQVGTNFAMMFTDLQMLEGILQDAAQLVRSGKPITAAGLGYKQSTWDQLQNDFGKYGIDIQSRAESLARSKGNPDPLTREDFLKISNATMAEMSGEGSVLTRPASTINSSTKKALFTFLGFRIWQTNVFLKMFRTPTGRTDARSLAKGLTTLALGFVPLSLAYSLAMDAYDDKLQGKKQAWRGLGTDKDVLDNLGAALDRVTGIGTPGFVGDIYAGLLSPYAGNSGANLLSVDARVVMVSQIRGLAQAINNAATHEWNYANVVRPFISPLGATGLLANLQLLNNTIGVEGVPLVGEIARLESSVVARTNAGNWLRIALKEGEYDLKAMNGTGTANKMTPHVTNMVLAAMRNDTKDFGEAYQKAIKASQAMGRDNPVSEVQNAFRSRHPLRAISRTTLTVNDYARVLRSLPESGQQAVTDAVNLMNQFGATIGVEPFYGSDGSRLNLLQQQARAAGYGDDVDAYLGR